MSQHLPTIETLDQYRACYRQVEVWLPAISAICQRHQLPAPRAEGFRSGSDIVFLVDEQVVKLSSPLFRAQFLAERAALPRVYGRLSAPTPELLAEGELEGWPYFILRRVPGLHLEDVWPKLS